MNYVLFQLGAWLVETPLGRRWSLALSTFTTAMFCLVFVIVEKTWAVRTTTVVICLSATVRVLNICAFLTDDDVDYVGSTLRMDA